MLEVIRWMYTKSGSAWHRKLAQLSAPKAVHTATTRYGEVESSYPQGVGFPLLCALLGLRGTFVTGSLAKVTAKCPTWLPSSNQDLKLGSEPPPPDRRNQQKASRTAGRA